MLAGCLRLTRLTPAPEIVSTTTTPLASSTPSATPHPYPWDDELQTMSGICFEAAAAVAGQVFVFRSAADHIAFYDSVDAGGLCRRPIERFPFDFETGRALAGLWSPGVGCVARHDVRSIERAGDAIKRIELEFVTEGLCNYELLRPFWIGVDASDDFTIEVHNVP